MAAIDDVKTQWLVCIAKISDPLIQAEATYALDNYIAAIAKQAALEANEIQSYSIGGRTFTRRDAVAGQRMINNMRSELTRMCYGTVTLADMNVDVSQP